MAEFFLEPLGKGHDRASFRCGVEALDAYLQRQASQDARKDVAAPFVLVEAATGLIAGYFTLSALGLNLEELPADLAEKLPRYGQVPAALIGRLAVDLRFQGRGVGRRLLGSACQKALAAADTLAAWAVVVDAKDEEAERFYRRFGFAPLPEQPRRLFLTMKQLRHTAALLA
jgi:GNAT superfamily N-acetyltransferase